MTDSWLIAAFSPVSLFSLRSTQATSKGGKTLLVPTPYAVKMALVDAAFRALPAGESAARATFDLIKARQVRFRPSLRCLVRNTFIRALQPARAASDEAGESVGPFSRTIVYREFAFLDGPLLIALAKPESPKDCERLHRLFAHINQFGKRGSFFQFESCVQHLGELPGGFSLAQHELAGRAAGLVERYRVPQYLDDFGPELCAARDGFDRISTYSDKRITLGKHRVLRLMLLPYQVRRATRYFTEYERTVE